MDNNKNTDTSSVDKNERVVISNGISQVDSRKVPPYVTKRAPRKRMKHSKDIRGGSSTHLPAAIIIRQTYVAIKFSQNSTNS